jgi:hypothetical protein
MILLGRQIAELRAVTGTKGLIEFAEAGDQQVAAAEADALHPSKRAQKMLHSIARRSGSYQPAYSWALAGSCPAAGTGGRVSELVM